MTSKRYPTYDLGQLQERVRRGDLVVTRSAGETAALLCFDESDIVECVLALTRRSFRKSMEADKRPGLWQDVYKTHHHSMPVYVKLQETLDDRTCVISFKLDEEP